MLCLTCTMISSVDFAHYRVSRAKDWVNCGLWYNNILDSVTWPTKVSTFSFINFGTFEERIDVHTFGHSLQIQILVNFSD